MKKTNIILSITLILFLISNIKNIYSKEVNDNYGNEYVLLILQGVNGDEIGFPSVFVRNNEISSNKDKKDLFRLITFTRSECEEVINKRMQKSKKLFVVEKPDSFKNRSEEHDYEVNKYNQVDKYFVVYNFLNGEGIYNYFCIPLKLWNMADRNVEDEEYRINNIEIVTKDHESLFKVMSKCGLTGFDFYHINLHDTPFICDKYSKKNPIPYNTFTGITGVGDYGKPDDKPRNSEK